MSAIAGRVLLIPKGAYDANVTYHMLDAVSYGGNSYVAKQTTAGNTPSADNAYWMLLSAGSAVASISDIGDVLITDLANGQVLKYNATSHKWENGDDTGGLLPHLIIISEDGESEVKAVKGGTEIIATRTSAGHYECDVPEFGTWTIHAVLNEDDATVNLVVDTVKVYTVDDSHFHADITVTFPYNLSATCSCSKEGTTTLYATESPYTFTVHEAGTYTLTCNYDGNDYTDTVTISTSGSTITKVLPVPATAPTDDINLWLFYGGIDNSQSTYSSLADILADTDALSTLMASNNAVDYLVVCTSWANTVSANQSAMTYIGLNNYCANTLLADSVWKPAICNSTYFESVLNVKNPNMTGTSTPEGTCFVSSAYGGYTYGAFDGVTNSAQAQNVWLANGASNQYCGYRFTQNVKVYRVDTWNMSETSVINRSIKDFKVQYSLDGTNYDDAASGTLTKSAGLKTTTILNSTASTDYWRFLGINNYGSGDGMMCISEVRFYGRVDV